MSLTLSQHNNTVTLLCSNKTNDQLAIKSNSVEMQNGKGQRTDQPASRQVNRLTKDEFSFHSHGKAFLQSTSLAVRARLDGHFTFTITSTTYFLHKATPTCHLHTAQLHVYYRQFLLNCPIICATVFSVIPLHKIGRLTFSCLTMCIKNFQLPQYLIELQKFEKNSAEYGSAKSKMAALVDELQKPINLHEN